MDAIKRSLGLSTSPEATNSTSMVIVDNLGSVPILDEISVGSTAAPETESHQAQVKDRIMSIWNNMKFSKTFWDVKKTSFSRNSPVVILGESYLKGNSGGNSRRSSYSSNEDEDSSAEQDPWWFDFHSKLWMTYRKDFPCFPGTNVDSDCGWGCMIRAGQMIVSNSLIMLHLGRSWRWTYRDKNDAINADDLYSETMHQDIARLFADEPAAPLSIHKIIEIGRETIQCKPGDWFGPGSTAHLFRQALELTLNENQHPQVAELLNMRIYVAMDGTVYKQDVHDLGSNPASPFCKPLSEEKPKKIRKPKKDPESFSLVDDAAGFATDEEGFVQAVAPEEEEAEMVDDEVRNYSMTRELSVDGETWLTEEFSANVVEGCPEPQQPRSWTPVLILVPVRLGGGEKLNPIYTSCVKALLAHEMCVGIIGGRPRHALYFLGYQDDNLIHLDPHLVQDYVNMNHSDYDLSSFHCKTMRKMPLSKMDPSCCIGFLCRSNLQFQKWCQEVKLSAAPSGTSDYPMFSVVNGRVTDHMADSVRLLNQMSLAGEDDEEPDGAVGCSGTSAGAGGTCLDDSDDFVVL